MTEQKLIALGCKVWENYGKRRIYINDEHLEAVFGLKVERYKSGSIKHCELNGEKISNNKAFKLLLDKPYFDCIAQTWHSNLNPII